MVCPHCGHTIALSEPPPTLAAVKTLIERLAAKDRSMLRPWLLAKFDVQGQSNPHVT